jgi:hypothetical protein
MVFMKAKNTHYLLIVLVIAGIGIVLFAPPKPKAIPTSHFSRLREEQAVYSILLADSAYRLEENTTLGMLSIKVDDYSDLSGLNLDCSMFSVFTDLCTVMGFPDGAGIKSAVDRETVIDFQKNNSHSYPLKDYLPPSNNHILLSFSDIQGLPDSGWFSLSRVGFNSAFTQALIMLNQVAKVNGDVMTCSQFYEILEKVEGSWILRKEVQINDCELPPSQN